MTKKNKTGGLAGVVAGESAIATVGLAGKGLNYRGYSIDALASFATFEEVAYLLMRGRLPNQTELDEYTEELVSLRTLPEALKKVLKLPLILTFVGIVSTGILIVGYLFNFIF